MAEIQGSYDELFTAVPDALAALLDAGAVSYTHLTLPTICSV